MENEQTFRIAVLLLLITAFGISFYFRRKADRESGEKISRKVDGSLLMTVIKIGGLILWLAPIAYIANPQWLSWSDLDLPSSVRWAGIMLGVVFVWTFYWLFSHIGSGISPTSATRKRHPLVTSGPYRWIRHPLYTFGALFFLALGLITDSWIIMLLGLLVFVVMAIRTPKEEANLIEKFGDEYREYMKQTGRFLPRF